MIALPLVKNEGLVYIGEGKVVLKEGNEGRLQEGKGKEGQKSVQREGCERKLDCN